MPEDPAPLAEAPVSGTRLALTVAVAIVVITGLCLAAMQLVGPFTDRDGAAPPTTAAPAVPDAPGAPGAPGAGPTDGAGWRCTSQDYPVGEKRGTTELGAIATLTTPGAKAPEGWTRIEPNRWQQRDEAGGLVVQRTVSLHEDFVQVWSVVRVDRCEHDGPAVQPAAGG